MTTTAYACVVCAAFVVSTSLPHLTGIRCKSRATMIWCCCVMATVMMALGAHCHMLGSFDRYRDQEFHRMWPIYLLGLFYAAYAVGPFRLTWHFAKRMVPADVYFTVRSALVAVSWLATFAVTRILPRLIDEVGVGWLFWYMSTMCVGAAVFVYHFVPATFRSGNGDERKSVIGGSSSVSSGSSETTNLEPGDV